MSRALPYDIPFPPFSEFTCSGTVQDCHPSVGKHQWLFIFIKDILFATPILVLMFLATSGLFNNCYCVSGAMFRGRLAEVVLNPAAFFPRNNHVIYPAAVFTGLAFQVMVLVLVRLGYSTARLQNNVVEGPTASLFKANLPTPSHP
jgi:hypothetical protein